MAQNKKAKWIKTTLTLYGKQVKLWYQTIDELPWYPSADLKILHIVACMTPVVTAATTAFSPSTSLSERHANPADLLATLAFGGLLPRCQAVSGLRRSPEPSGQGDYAHCSSDLLYLRSVLALVRPVGLPTRAQVHPGTPVVSTKGVCFLEDILRTLRHATWQERIFSHPALDAHTRKILQPFVEWAKTLT